MVQEVEVLSIAFSFEGVGIRSFQPGWIRLGFSIWA